MLWLPWLAHALASCSAQGAASDVGTCEWNPDACGGVEATAQAGDGGGDGASGATGAGAAAAGSGAAGSGSAGSAAAGNAAGIDTGGQAGAAAASEDPQPVQSGGDGAQPPSAGLAAGSGGSTAGQPDGDASTAEPDAAAQAEPDAGVDSGPAPQVADYTLLVSTPQDGASLSGTVTVRGFAPRFLNVEVWDATHTHPPLAQVVPGADGRFAVSVDVSALPSGPTTWTVHAWDSPPGSSFSNTDSVSLQLQIAGGTASRDGFRDPGTEFVPAGYKLVFSDEFDAASLDTAKWNTLAPWGVQYYEDSNQQQAFVPEAVTLGQGVASLTARRSDGSGTGGKPYSSGSITTNGTFTHGYFEARVKLPRGKGFWQAYWLTSSTRWPPEWDIFETIDGVIYGYPHPIESGKCDFVGGLAGPDSTYVMSDLYDGYHVYGFHWTASDLRWYVDGALTEHWAVDAAAGANDPYWLNLSFQIGGDWPGNPDATTPFPSSMRVDYVRVYQAS